MSTSRGIVKVTNDRNKLRIVLPVKLSESVYGVKQKRISLGLEDTEDNRKLAQAKANLIQSDIDFERFDRTLKKYGLAEEEHATEKKIMDLTLVQLWDKYTQYKAPSLKPGTLFNYEQVRRLLIKAGNHNALELREKLLKVTSNHWTKKTLTLLSACHDWGIKHGLVVGNSFKGMAAELPKNNYEINSTPNPFTESEKLQILSNFFGDIHYNYYYSFVQFLFMTGCRPSEAVGLQFKHIATDWTKIYFSQNLTHINGKATTSEGSKNNRKRIFPVNEALKSVLKLQLLKKGEYLNAFVFSAPSSIYKPINYNNFSRRAWDWIVNPIKAGTTPYCCRDTFISEQISKGIPPAIVAKWVDNSVKTIEKYYLGDTEEITPL